MTDQQTEPQPESGTVTVRSTIESFIGRAPERLRAGLMADLAAGRSGPPTERRETPHDAAERRRVAQSRQSRQWRERCPVRFRDATLDDLTGEDGLTDGRVARWGKSGHRVLVLFSEVTGNGKTHSAYAVGWEAVNAGQWVVCYTATELTAALQPSNEDALAVESDLRRCDVLLVDDLGREKQSEWRAEQWQALLDYRWREGKRLIVTTNLAGADFVARYGAPIVDRIIDGADIVRFTGAGHRAHVPW